MLFIYLFLFASVIILFIHFFLKKKAKKQQVHLLETYFVQSCPETKIAATIAITELSPDKTDNEKREIIENLWNAGGNIDNRRYPIKSIQFTNTVDPADGILVFRATTKPIYNAFPPREQKYWVTYCPSGPMDVFAVNRSATIVVARLTYPKGVDYRTYEEGPGHFLAPHTRLTPLATIKAK